MPSTCRVLLVLVTLAASAAGCLTVSGKQLPQIAAPKRAKTPPSFEVTVGDFVYRAVGGQMKTSYRYGLALNERLFGLWQDKGYAGNVRFVERSQFSGAADFNVTLSGSALLDGSIGLQIVAGATLFVVPDVHKDTFSVTYTFEEVETGRKLVVELADHYTHVTQILLIPVSPFAAVGKRSMHDNMANHFRAQFLGWRIANLKKSPPTAPASAASMLTGPPPVQPARADAGTTAPLGSLPGSSPPLPLSPTDDQATP